MLLLHYLYYKEIQSIYKTSIFSTPTDIAYGTEQFLNKGEGQVYGGTTLPRGFFANQVLGSRCD